MSEESSLDKLKSTPVTELNFGSASIRRSIQRAGFDTLTKLLDLSEKEIDALFTWKDADEIINLKKRYNTSPEEFAFHVLRKREIEKGVASKAPAKAEASYVVQKKPHIPTIARIQYLGDSPISLPPLPFSKALQGFEKRARETLDDLDDIFENVMVYQAFEEFSTDLDELSDAFSELFDFFSSQSRDALRLIDRRFRNAFLVFVADRARSVYKDGNLWGNFFDGLNIPDGNAQGLFKQLFVDHIKRRKMPLYARDEETHYYFYTALLHGGLSADSWENLWEECIIPMTRAVSSGDYGIDGEMDGRSLLKELKSPESRFAPKKSVLNILEKAPDSTIAPLFDASMRVAAQIAGYRGFRSGVTMLSSFGLPDVAMDALRELQERRTVTSRSHSASTPSEKHPDERRFVYFPVAHLQLNLSEGVVSIRWNRQQFPLQFADKRIDYYIDGKKELSSEFAVSVGKCILEAASITVRPQVRYDVELKLMQKDERTGDYVEIASTNQTFTRSKPGCFEFIKDAKGLYRMRERNEKITRKRRIAYIVKDGYQIDAGQGMTPVPEYETSGRWSDTQIYIYDVEPGSAGSLVDELPVAVVRGNMSEIKAMAGAASSTRGVDANPDDAVTDENLAASAAFARQVAEKLGCVVAVTGVIDLVADKDRAFAVRNGDAIMGKITGTGCMLSCVTGAYATANPEHPLEAAVAAIAGWGLAGEVARSRMGELDGNGSFRTYLLDAAYNLTAEQLMAGARVEEV